MEKNNNDEKKDDNNEIENVSDEAIEYMLALRRLNKVKIINILLF